MKLHAAFLLVGVSLAAAQTYLWSFESPKPAFTSRNDESKPSSNTLGDLHLFLRNLAYFNLLPQKHVPDFENPSQLRLDQVQDRRPLGQQIESRALYGSQDEETGRFFISPYFPFGQNTVFSAVVSVTTTTVTSTCIPTTQLSNGASATPCSLLNAGKRKKRDAVSEEELIEPSQIEPLEPTVLKSSVEQLPEDVQISSSHDETGSSYRNPRFIFTTNINSQSTSYLTITNVVIVTQNFVLPAGSGYLYCLPAGYLICSN